MKRSFTVEKAEDIEEVLRFVADANDDVVLSRLGHRVTVKLGLPEDVRKGLIERFCSDYPIKVCAVTPPPPERERLEPLGSHLQIGLGGK